ncbi:MAG: FemAB-like protein [Proteobacteria bacterium]|nr:MAG: FemAB-like protein [Pseudomonadota bacterium]
MIAAGAQRADDDAAWDAYVERRPDACLGHASMWRHVFANAYGIDSVRLEARDGDGHLRGVLPLAPVRTLVGARSYVSLPFLDAAGVLCDDAEAESALLDAARALGAPVELRQAAPLATLPISVATRVELWLALGGGEEARWRALPGKVRNQTRKAWKEKLVVGDPSPRDVADFCRVHRTAMRELGSPPHAEAFFRAVLSAFGARARCFVVRDGARAVGGLVAIEYAGVVTVPWASTLASERSRCPNHALYWEALRWAESRGAHAFSFGRSPWNSGTHRFKKGWGATERPLHWIRIDARGAATAAQSAGDSRPLQLLSRLWKQLPPTLCDRVGPLLRPRISS